MNSSTPNWAVVVQARTGSTRLADKMILPFYEGRSIFQIVLETLLSVFPKEKIILATTVNPKDDALKNVADSYDIKVFRGSEEDVLSRFVGVSREYDLDSMLRICADNPFLLKQNLKELAEKGKTAVSDYLAYFFEDNLPSIRSHSGFFGEWVSSNALKRISDLTTDKFYHEHVTNYIYHNESAFNIEKMQVPEQKFCRSVRLTIDTESDFNLAKEIFAMFVGEEQITLSKLKAIIEANPAYLDNMQRMIRQHSK